MKKRLDVLFYNIIFIIFLEIVFKASTIKEVISLNLFYMILFSITIAIVITLLETLFKKEKINRIITIIITFLVEFIFIAQFIYFKYYEAIFSVYSLFNGGQVLEFVDGIINVILHNLLPIILMLIPVIVPIIKKIPVSYQIKDWFTKGMLLLIAVFIFIASLIIIELEPENSYSAHRLYYETHVPTMTVSKFGLITTMRLDAKRTIFGFDEVLVAQTEPEEPKVEEEAPVQDKVIEYNVMDIDFDSLIANEKNKTIKSMHEYFKSIKPTNKNDYTGMFKGKNLIVFVAEAYSPIALSEKYTPTLYRLYKEGFQFTNFYTPYYFVSTSDGEYTSLLSLLPKHGYWSMKTSRKNYLPFAYGNIFKKLGYETRAYHDGTYGYYGRNLSHPNMGYTFKACGNGLKITCKKWPQSDVEMIEATAKEYINSEHYVTYYMTISGHLAYNFMGGNASSSKHKKEVADLNASTPIKAYIAAQMEFDQALKLLIDKLEANGTLKDTVIAITADHYPYGLEDADIKGYADYIKEFKFDVHRNNFLLWNSEMKEPIVVDKVAYQLDALPTILNLFGVDYDSRLLMGTDIMSDSSPLVIYNDRSWITDKGRYNANNKRFTSTTGEEVSKEYIEKINSIVANKYSMSALMLDKDYYKYVIKK